MLLAVLMGAGCDWLLLGIVTIIYRTWRRELSWNPSWNGIVSPLATLRDSVHLAGSQDADRLLRHHCLRSHWCCGS